MHGNMRQGAGVAPPIDCVKWLAAVERPALLVLPTTREVLRLVALEVRRPGGGVVAVADPAVLPGALDPVAYLTLCREQCADGAGAPSAFVFTDQIVDPPISMVLVEYRGACRFLPATEMLARANYGVAVHAWTAAGLVDVTGEADQPIPVLRVLKDYYLACEQLGDAWLMRDRQRRAQVAARIDAAVERVRVFESAVMQAFAGSDLCPDAQALLADLASRRAALAATRADVA